MHGPRLGRRQVPWLLIAAGAAAIVVVAALEMMPIGGFGSRPSIIPIAGNGGVHHKNTRPLTLLPIPR